MKRLLLILGVLALGPACRAQQYQFTAPDCEFAFRYAVVNSVISPQAAPLGGTRVPASADVSTQSGYDNRFKNCVTWTMVYHVDGPAAVSIELDEAPTSAGIPGTWATWPTAFIAPGTALPLTATTSAQVTTFAYFPWISAILNSATGNGQVEGHVYGWRAAPGQDASVTGVSVVPVTTDPCQSSSIAKNSVVISIAAAGTTQLIAASGTTQIYTCSFIAVAGAGTNPSFQLEYGTGGTCGTGTVTLTGAMSTGVTVSTTVGGPIFQYASSGQAIKAVPAGNGLCAVAGGTTPTFNGVLTFVQK